MRSAAVFDIDGTIADARQRLPLLTGSPSHEDWVRFFDAAEADPVLPAGVALAKELSAEHEIVWLTGRPERIRDATERWLSSHDLPPGPLVMHPTDDRRPTALVKLEQLREIARLRPVHVVVDDDPRVVRLLTDNGFPVRLADWLPWRAPGD